MLGCADELLPNRDRAGWALLLPEAPKGLAAPLVCDPKANPVDAVEDAPNRLGWAFGGSFCVAGALPNTDFCSAAGVEAGAAPKVYFFSPPEEAAPKTSAASVEPFAAASVLGGNLAAEVGAPPPKEKVFGAPVDLAPKMSPALVSSTPSDGFGRSGSAGGFGPGS